MLEIPKKIVAALALAFSIYMFINARDLHNLAAIFVAHGSGMTRLGLCVCTMGVLSSIVALPPSIELGQSLLARSISLSPMARRIHGMSTIGRTCSYSPSQCSSRLPASSYLEYVRKGRKGNEQMRAAINIILKRRTFMRPPGRFFVEQFP